MVECPNINFPTEEVLKNLIFDRFLPNIVELYIF